MQHLSPGSSLEVLQHLLGIPVCTAQRTPTTSCRTFDSGIHTLPAYAKTARSLRRGGNGSPALGTSPAALPLGMTSLMYTTLTCSPYQSAQIDNVMLHSGVQVHMTAQLIYRLPSLGSGVGMEAPLWALLHQLQSPRRRQPEQAAALSGIPGRHDNCNCLLQHSLQGTETSTNATWHDNQ